MGELHEFPRRICSPSASGLRVRDGGPSKGFRGANAHYRCESRRKRGKHGVPYAANGRRQGMNVWRRMCSLAVVLLLCAAVAAAQDKKHEAQLRTVRGVVSDKSESPLSGSVVFLKNVRTNSVRSSYTDDTGNYRFSGLDPNADYELHAEKEGSKSQTRTVSSFDSRKDIVLNLKIDKKKN